MKNLPAASARPGHLPKIPTTANLPIRLGPPEEFACLREFFRRAEFDDLTLLRVLGLEDMSDLGSVHWEEIQLETLPVEIRWCLQVFVRGLKALEKESQAI